VAGGLWARRERGQWARVGLGRGVRWGGVVHGPTGKKREGEGRRKGEGEVPPHLCLSAKPREIREREGKRGRGMRREGHAVVHVPYF
jgi:hypothetical protein